MRQIRNYADSRHYERCVYCGDGGIKTRDHVPSKVLLDAPYPENLPVLPACAGCNASFAADEEYVACLLECTVAGSTDPGLVTRGNVRRILGERPALRARLEKARIEASNGVVFSVEESRVRNVVLKLARGHAAYELGEPQQDEPDLIEFTPLPSISGDRRVCFESVPVFAGWPEVGSRAMQRIAAGEHGWIVVQEGRYRFVAAAGGSVIVRIVLSEYLACEVMWH
jgi:hypothetical protein